MSKAPAQIVNSKDEAISNILAYHESLNTNGGEKLAKLMPHARAWYVLENEGRLYFGPSKYIGYNKMTAEYYVNHTKEMDGRTTEKRLAQWGQLVQKGDVEYQRFSAALSEFLGIHGASPNKEARISFISQDQAMNRYTEADIIHALKVLISTLSDQAKKDLKRAL